MKLRPLLALTAVLPALALAAPVPLTRRCVIANMDCWTVRAGFKHLTPEMRVDRLNDRLARIIGRENLAADNVYVVPRGPYTDLYVGRSPLFTCTPQDAMAEHSGNTRTLAQKWAGRLRRALPQARPMANVDLPRRRPAAARTQGRQGDDPILYYIVGPR